MTVKEMIDVIDAERIRQRISQEQYAAMCGMSDSTIKKWKAGRNEPTVHCMSVLAEGLGLELRVCKKNADV